jgi:hypothetical protein
MIEIGNFIESNKIEIAFCLGFAALLIIALDQFGLHDWIIKKIGGRK